MKSAASVRSGLEGAASSLTARTIRWELFLISSIALFLELAIIRWLSTEIRIFAYFKNLPLMAAFLGLGIGFALHRESERFFPWFPRLVACLTILIAWAPGLGLTHVIFVDPRRYFLLGVGFGDHAAQSIPSLLKTMKALGVIILLFFLATASFAALGTKVGELLNREKPLAGYSINVAGSLLGIGAFSLVSYLEWAPPGWLVLAYILLSYFYYRHKALALFYFSISLAATLAAGILNPALWSPYYRVSIRTAAPEIRLTSLYVNYDQFQSIQDLSEQHLARFTESAQRSLNRHYNIPYRLSKKKIDSVLILGGGAGNDAAAALRNGAKIVDVVEIDPVIAQLGRELHPEKPYASENINLHIDDARSFLQKTTTKYDLVVFATLDSHTAFSSLSSLRLDNFVFTRESIQRVKGKLRPDGGIAVNFFAINPWLYQRHFNLLREAMDMQPLAYGNPENQEVLFLAGNSFDPNRDLGLTNYRPIDIRPAVPEVEPTTDDWPFLFLEKRGIPFHYLLPLVLISLLSLIPLRMLRLNARHVNWHLFFMGAAFLLIETKAVTALALTLGSTWTVNSIVIGSILTMILVANLLVGALSRFDFSLLYTGLSATLIFNFLFPLDVLNSLGYGLRVLTSGVFTTIPLFFAALIFAKAFAVVESPSIALASNLFGSLVGGLLEYLDMWIGLSSLNLVALALYLVSLAFLLATLRDKGMGQQKCGTS